MSADKFAEPRKLYSWLEERAVMSSHIKAIASGNETLHILEAGCGTGWGIDLSGVQYLLTGVDLDKDALELRLKEHKDLDTIIHGDLRTVTLEDCKYDAIFNCYVLEHVDGAEKVLKNFVRWLKPGGILVLVIPNRDSIWGFVTRMTPFWFHIAYRRYIEGIKSAGKPGYAPYPTFYDKVVSRAGIYDFCEREKLNIAAEYSIGHRRRTGAWVIRGLTWLFIRLVYLASFGRLSIDHANCMFVIQKRK